MGPQLITSCAKLALPNRHCILLLLRSSLRLHIKVERSCATGLAKHRDVRQCQPNRARLRRNWGLDKGPPDTRTARTAAGIGDICFTLHQLERVNRERTHLSLARPALPCEVT